MPANRRSLRLTDSYRNRLVALSDRVELAARRAWPTIEGFDATDWPERTAAVATRAQTEAVRLSAGYLAAYVRSETGRGTTPRIDSREYAGKSRDGRALTESLISPLIGVRAALKEGREPTDALNIGLDRALRAVGLDTLHAARQSLSDLMEAHPQVEGWQRAVRGTCGACLGDIAVEVSVQLPSLPLRVHPNCQCVTQPVVTGVPNRFPLATGIQRFAEMTNDEQDAQFGPEKAKALREQRIQLQDLKGESELAEAPNFITERPLEAVA